MPLEILERQAQECVRYIETAKSIAVLTGAGISTNAGIPDFRGPQGLYITKKYDAEKIFDIHYFFTDPLPFYEFARDFIQMEEHIVPTAAHRFLAHLEQDGKLKGIITQNIDSLHQKAGSRNVIEMHGSFWLSYCQACRQEFSYDAMKEILKNHPVGRCHCGGIIKPDIVFFGEGVKHFDSAAALAREADLFFVIGTSCAVYPAAIVPTLTSGQIILVNKGENQLSLSGITLDVRDDIDAFFGKVSEIYNSLS